MPVAAVVAAGLEGDVVSDPVERITARLLAAGVEPGDEIELSRENVVSVFRTKHTLPSLGFLVWERRKKLKEELQGLRGDQIRDLRLAGTEVTHEHRLPLVAFLGDTAPEGLDEFPAVYRAQILILELTFVAPSHRKDKIH